MPDLPAPRLVLDPSAPPSLHFTNACLVLPEGVRHGSLRVVDGRIASMGEGAPYRDAIACDGDLILPGIVDLHTDNLERQVQPRSHARWPSRSAFLSHDAQCAAAGITTVLDALCVGDLGFDENRRRTCAEGIADLDALAETGLLRAEHALHLRCELPAPDMPGLIAPLAAHPRLRMVSLMDHSPGEGQYADLPAYRRLRLRDGASAVEVEASIERLREGRRRLRAPNRAALLARMAGRGVPLASHDDRTAAEVAENAASGIAISEFPTTLEAARAARAAGMAVIAGAPNLVRGGSHTGNVAVSALLDEGLIDAFASDYVPASLVEAAFLAAGRLGLPAAWALVSATPARLAGYPDRGAIRPGLRADLIRVRLHGGTPVIRAVWRGGERVG